MKEGIIKDIYDLCEQHKYHEAMAMSRGINGLEFSLRAIGLVQEHKRAAIRDGKFEVKND